MFILNFVKPVVGVVLFNNRIKDKNRSADSLFTKTDEAFALLMLENNWDRWIDIFKLNNNRIPPIKRKRDGEEKVSISNIRPKYTDGGISYSDESSASQTKGRGWSEKGIRRFNEIIDMVKKSRKDHPNFLKDFVTKERQKLNQNKYQNKKGIEHRKHVVIPAHDKFCEDVEACSNDENQDPACDEDNAGNEEYDPNDDDENRSRSSSSNDGDH